MSSEADAIQDSIRYLASDEAMRSLESDTYWPKWHSPWWHMTTLHEMGLADLIPKATVRKMVEHLQEDGMLEASCHCALGNIYQTLAACGVAVDEELPGIRPWFLRHQLPDGGLNCDDAAYLSESKPSSLVGTLPPLEAVLFHTPREFTPEEAAFLDRGASCVLDRKLMLGSRSPDNAEEREDEPDWLKPCFPRLYLYDVLRGLRFIVQWAKRRRQPLPLENIRDVVDYLRLRYPDGQVLSLIHI